MDVEAEERIRTRAYELWQKSGKPEGGADAFWLQAERELNGSPTSASPGPKPLLPG